MAGRMDRTELEVTRERCFLVGAIIRGRYGPHEDPLNELACLVDTAGGEVVGRLTQTMDRPHRRTFLGKGRVEELADAVIEAEADTVVVDDNLSPTQLGTLEEACRRKVIDRNEVILDIFSSRAGSHQSKLQVELAQLEYELPRLIRKWTHLERLGGGIGTRGPGESQIESDRRMLRRRINTVRRELDKIEGRKVREVASRSEVFTVSLVGYTNAGKSSLLNRLTGADAFVEDRLFATLDTLTRRVELQDGMAALISDTVGFIRRIPHNFVASFHATLEEAAQANLLIQVIDGSDPDAGEHITSVENTLRELDMGEKDRLYVFNKEDAVTDRAMLDGFTSRTDPFVTVSAHTGAGIPELLDLIHSKVVKGFHQTTLRFDAGDGRRFALINELAQVKETRYEDNHVIMTASLQPLDLVRIRQLPGALEIL